MIKDLEYYYYKKEKVIEMLENYIPDAWKPYLIEELKKDYFKQLDKFVEKEYATKTIFPKKESIFAALSLVKPQDVHVVILGQDPYHEQNQAHGLSFSVQKGVPLPKSLINIYTELEDDLGISPSKSGNLECWAKQGVLMLNSVLTVENHLANSHKGKGWEIFTAKIIEVVLQQSQPKVFILWGKQAQDTFYAVANSKHYSYKFIRSAHPSPLSAYRGFFGSKPFSRTNKYLESVDVKPINWKVDD